jgi:hypothetical protein
MAKFWKCTGETAKKIIALLDDRKARINAFFEHAKKHGADKPGLSTGGMHTSGAYLFEQPPDSKVWKKVKGTDNFYRPKASSKIGKEIKREHDEIFAKCPNGHDIAATIKADVFFHGQWKTPGCTQDETDPSVLWINTHDNYEPKDGVEADMVRVSDLEYEAATKGDDDDE